MGWTEVLYFVIALLAANAVALAWRWSKESAAAVRPRFDLRWMWALVHDSRHFFLANIGYLLQTQLDRVFILWMLPVENLGIYVVALGCAGAHLTVTRSLGLVVFARGAGMTQHEAMGDFARLFRHAVVVSVALSLLIAALMPFAVPMLFGSDFGAAVLPAIILVLGNLFGSLASLVDEALRAQAKPMPGLQGRYLGSGVFLGLAFILSAELGIIGVAVASAVGQMAFLAWMVRQVRRIAPNPWLPVGPTSRRSASNCLVSFAGSRLRDDPRRSGATMSAIPERVGGETESIPAQRHRLAILDANSYWTEQIFSACAPRFEVLLMKPRDLRAHFHHHRSIRGDRTPRLLRDGLYEQRFGLLPGWMFARWRY